MTIKPLFILAMAAALAACDVDFQTSSGANYLAARGKMSDGLTEAASYSPQLAFPARTGVVRLVYGVATVVPQAERDLFKRNAPVDMGDFILIGPLEAELAGVGYWRKNSERLRKLAASKHLDYLLVIAFYPSDNTTEAVFLDVRNGYPYASFQDTGEGRGVRNFWGGRPRNDRKVARAASRMARHAEPKFKALFAGLMARAAKAKQARNNGK